MTLPLSSPSADLISARDSALAIVEIVRRWPRFFSEHRDPYVGSERVEGTPSRPTLSELRALRDACQRLQQVGSPALLEEVAGLTSPSGLRGGGSFFSSAHQLSIGLANAMLDCLAVILENDSSRTFAAKWAEDPVYYRQLLWDTRGIALAVAHCLPRARMLLECESAQAIRHRQLLGVLASVSAPATAPDSKAPDVQPKPVVLSDPPPNPNPYSPSSRAAVLRLLTAREQYAVPASGGVKKMSLYNGAKLRGQSAQRALAVAIDRGFLDPQLGLTDAGRVEIASLSRDLTASPAHSREVPRDTPGT